MSAGGRAGARERLVRRAALVAAALVLVALLLLVGGHWILGVLFGVAAAVAIWFYVQARSVR